MKCPICKSNLVVTGQQRLETLIEHISDPNGEPSLKNAWQCINTDCQCFQTCAWDDFGDFYSNGYHDRVRDLFPNGDYSALGSLARKLSAEISGHGLPKKKYLHPALMLWVFQPYIQWHGKADNDGNILKKWRTLEILKKDPDSGDYRYVATFCWKTWSFLWDRFKHEYRKGEYQQAFAPSRNRSWVNRWFETFVRLRYFYNVPPSTHTS